jgi:hypothetical protein
MSPSEIIGNKIDELKKLIPDLPSLNSELQKIKLIFSKVLEGMHHQVSLTKNLSDRVYELELRSNFFLNFIVSSPENKKALVTYAQAIVNSETENTKHLQPFATWLLAQPQLKQEATLKSKPLHKSDPLLGANIIPFPKMPQDEERRP